LTKSTTTGLTQNYNHSDLIKIQRAINKISHILHVGKQKEK
jgi:hypothetical protein